MVKYVGNCDVIDWKLLLKQLQDQAPAYVGPRHKAGDPVDGVDELAEMWKNAGYKTIHEGGNAGWDMYLPGTNFSEEIALQFANWLGLTNYTNVWISRIHPGKMAPWHWDVTDNETTLKGKEIVRYHCHMTEPEVGHVLIVDNHCLYNQQIGNTYQWDSRTSWHAGANCGMTPKYLFNFWHCL